MSAVYFVKEGTRDYWRASDEAADTFLCAIASGAYDTELQVRDCFAQLVSMLATHYRRKFVAGAGAPAASRLSGFPCETCAALEADDVRHAAAQVAELGQLALSPGGLPIGCCRVHIVGGMSGRPDTPRSATW
jgi:hypothetical protein